MRVPALEQNRGWVIWPLDSMRSVNEMCSYLINSPAHMSRINLSGCCRRIDFSLSSVHELVSEMSCSYLILTTFMCMFLLKHFFHSFFLPCLRDCEALSQLCGWQMIDDVFFFSFFSPSSYCRSALENRQSFPLSQASLVLFNPAGNNNRKVIVTGMERQSR